MYLLEQQTGVSFVLICFAQNNVTSIRDEQNQPSFDVTYSMIYDHLT